VLGRQPGQRPVGRDVLGHDLPGGQGHPDPGERQHDVLGVGLEIGDQAGDAAHDRPAKVDRRDRVEDGRAVQVCADDVGAEDVAYDAHDVVALGQR